MWNLAGFCLTKVGARQHFLTRIIKTHDFPVAGKKERTLCSVAIWRWFMPERQVALEEDAHPSSTSTLCSAATPNTNAK